MSLKNTSFFNPTLISGCSLWLDGADSSTISLSGSTVTQWNDKSRNGYNCISNSNYVGTSLPTYSNLTSQKYVNFAANQALVTSNNWNYSSAWSCFVAINSVTLGARWLISPHNSSPTPVFMGMNQGINNIFDTYCHFDEFFMNTLTDNDNSKLINILDDIDRDLNEYNQNNQPEGQDVCGKFIMNYFCLDPIIIDEKYKLSGLYGGNKK